MGYEICSVIFYTNYMFLMLVYLFSGLFFFTVVFYILSIAAIVLFYVFYANVSLVFF